MPTYSHRDHRAFRSAFAAIGSLSAATIALVALSSEAPGGFVGIAGVLGLAVLGAVSVLVSGRIADGYRADLDRVRTGRDVPGSLRAEVENRVGLDPTARLVGARSPSVRRPRPPTATV